MKYICDVPGGRTRFRIEAGRRQGRKFAFFMLSQQGREIPARNRFDAPLLARP